MEKRSYPACIIITSGENECLYEYEYCCTLCVVGSTIFTSCQRSDVLSIRRSRCTDLDPTHILCWWDLSG
jgi:hypothetical protein